MARKLTLGDYVLKSGLRRGGRLVLSGGTLKEATMQCDHFEAYRRWGFLEDMTVFDVCASHTTFPMTSVLDLHGMLPSLQRHLDAECFQPSTIDPHSLWPTRAERAQGTSYANLRNTPWSRHLDSGRAHAFCRCICVRDGRCKRLEGTCACERPGFDEDKEDKWSDGGGSESDDEHEDESESALEPVPVPVPMPVPAAHGTGGGSPFCSVAEVMQMDKEGWEQRGAERQEQVRGAQQKLTQWLQQAPWLQQQLQAQQQAQQDRK